MKNGSKGFTIVELVIVIAVVAVLAAVLIPTFSDIIKKANLSTDTQHVRNMNVILTSESAKAPPATPALLAEKLAANGISKLKPKSRFYTFYWLRNENVIILADEDDHPVFPEEYRWHEYDSGNWIDLKIAANLPEAPSEEFAPAGDVAQEYTVTLRKSGTTTSINFDYHPTATEGKQYTATLKIPDELSTTHKIRKVTVIMTDGDEEHEFVFPENRSAVHSTTVDVVIPAVTGNITINVSIIEFCKVTYTGNNLKDGKESITWLYEKGMLLHVFRHTLERSILKEGYMLTGAAGQTVSGRSLGDIYDENNRVIYSQNAPQITEDFEITLETAPIAYTVELRIMGMGEEDKYFTIQVENPQENHQIKLAELLGTDNFKVTYKSLTTKATHKDLKPACGYNDSIKTLIIKNFKSDCSIICAVEITE